MANNKKEKVLEAPKAKENFPDTAVSIRQNPQTKLWEVVIIKYNAELKAFYIESIEETGESRFGAIERFKIKVVNLGLV